MKNLRILSYLFVFSIILVFTSCGNNNDDPSPVNNANATIEGNSFVAEVTEARVDKFPPLRNDGSEFEHLTLAFATSGFTPSNLSITMNNPSIGTYDLADLRGVNLVYFDLNNGTSGIYSNDTGASGTFTINQLDYANNIIQGTFSFTLVDSFGGGTIEVEGGTYNVRLTDARENFMKTRFNGVSEDDTLSVGGFIELDKIKTVAGINDVLIDFNTNITPGTYSLSDNVATLSANYLGARVAQSMTLEITSHDTGKGRIIGSLTAQMEDILDSDNVIELVIPEFDIAYIKYE